MLFYILADFLSSCSISCWERSAEASNCNCGFVYFSFLFHQCFRVTCFTAVILGFIAHIHCTHLGLLRLLGGLAFYHYVCATLGFPGGTSGKEPACQCRRHKRPRFHPWVRRIPWRRAWQPTLVFLPEESQGQRSLAGYSQRVAKSWTQLTWHTSSTLLLLLLLLLSRFSRVRLCATP